MDSLLTNTTLKRQTKYCDAIETILATAGHATNAEILAQMQKTYPNVSATTVHRATARLAKRGTISLAPSTQDGSTRYDINIAPHDHFLCSVCSLLRDTDIKDKVIPILEASIDGCRIDGQITVSGVCRKCLGGKRI